MYSYLGLLSDVLKNGRNHDDRTGVGTLSVFGRQFRHDMKKGFPLLTTKKVPLRWVFEELKWFLSGSNNNLDLEAKGVDIWREWSSAEQCAKFGRDANDLGPIYGRLWRNFGRAEDYDMTRQPACGYQGVDQIANLLADIQATPNSRRLIVSGWHPYQQYRVALPPCHTVWQVKCFEDTKEMSLHLYARSIDIFLGLPFNIASYGLLLEMLSFVTGYKPHELIISFGDLHIYKNHLEQAKIQLDRAPYELPNVKIEECWTMAGQRTLARLLDLTWENIVLSNYQHHPKIKADVAI